mmetsp:Transcript_36736/g.118097  ORF Transcript_36736/g.118097 Transcript_36736/m.118097 type:complete len:377 (-) Transcript_36736:61-1191(-)
MPTEFLDSGGFPLVGDSCNYELCRQRDFLPFKCRYCGRSHCLQHAEPGSHECPKYDAAANDGVQALICPMCLMAVRYTNDSETASEAAWHAHELVCSGKPVEVPQCPVEGCTKRLTVSASVVCRSCGRRLCLKHRFEDLHVCRRASAITAAQQRAATAAQPPAASAAAAAPAVGGAVRGALLNKFESGSGAPSTSGTAGRGATVSGATVSSTPSAAHVVPVTPEQRSSLKEGVRSIASTAEAVPRREACLRTLLKVFSNVLELPREDKFRRLKRSNAALVEKVFGVPGAEAFLLSVGWRRESEDILELPEGVSSELLKVVVRFLQEQLDEQAVMPVNAEPAAVGTAVAADAWACVACTLLNPAASTVCDLCGVPRG